MKTSHKGSGTTLATRTPMVRERLRLAIAEGLAKSKERPRIFFRADDIGYPSKGFTELVSIFTQYRLPLCLAMVPVWTTPERVTELAAIMELDSPQWVLHQHGYAHKNHQLTGKKAEFGSAREAAALSRDLQRGRWRLEKYLEKSFFPVFTPPWNRCTATTLRLLIDHGYHGVSRNLGAHPESQSLPDLQISVDLHTRREPSLDQKVEGILKEIEESLASGVCGIMIHHQRMNRWAFAFLELLMVELTSTRAVVFTQFQELLDSR